LAGKTGSGEELSEFADTTPFTAEIDGRSGDVGLSVRRVTGVGPQSGVAGDSWFAVSGGSRHGREDCGCGKAEAACLLESGQKARPAPQVPCYSSSPGTVSMFLPSELPAI